MTQNEAMALVRRFGVECQKARSNMMESDLADVSELLTPWLFGPKNILNAVDIIERRGYVTGGELYNLMWVASRPEMAAIINIRLALAGEPPFPEPSLLWYGTIG